MLATGRGNSDGRHPRKGIRVIKDAYDRDTVGRYVEAIRPLLGSDALADSVTRAAAQLSGDGDARSKINAALPSIDAAQGSSGEAEGGDVPYLSREPAVSLVQSAVEDAWHERGAADQAPGTPGIWAWLRAHWVKLLQILAGLRHPGNFTPDDPDWVIKIAEAALGHLAMGNAPFNPKPAEHAISDSARLVIVGDWGTGLPRAQAVAKLMATEIAEALAAGRQVHVIHLGDVYYSGLPSEVKRHVLAYWPVTAEQARAGVTSWSLNGNHDMYSGGFGYYQNLLGDPRFAAQHSADGAATSFFRLTSPSWDFVGLDTSWDTDVLSKGASAVLQDPQAEFVATVALPAQSPPARLGLRQRGHRPGAHRQARPRPGGRARHRVVVGSRAPCHGPEPRAESPVPALCRARRCTRSADPCSRRADSRTRRLGATRFPEHQRQALGAFRLRGHGPGRRADTGPVPRRERRDGQDGDDHLVTRSPPRPSADE
jgi:hypothetical protein